MKPSKKYVLVEVTTDVPADAIPELDTAIAAKIKRALGHHYHNSPRKFRTADVTKYIGHESIEDKVSVFTPWIDLS